jgi:hypothetical protein
MHILIDILLACYGLMMTAAWDYRRHVKPVQQQLPEPVNIIRGVLLPDPLDDWKFTKITNKKAHTEANQYQYGNVIVQRTYNLETQNFIYNHVRVNKVMLSWDRDNDKVEQYYDAIRLAYCDRYALREPSLTPKPEPKQITND